MCRHKCQLLLGIIIGILISLLFNPCDSKFKIGQSLSQLLKDNSLYAIIGIALVLLLAYLSFFPLSILTRYINGICELKTRLDIIESKIEEHNREFLR